MCLASLGYHYMDKESLPIANKNRQVVCRLPLVAERSPCLHSLFSAVQLTNEIGQFKQDYLQCGWGDMVMSCAINICTATYVLIAWLSVPYYVIHHYHSNACFWCNCLFNEV